MLMALMNFMLSCITYRTGLISMDKPNEKIIELRQMFK